MQFEKCLRCPLIKEQRCTGPKFMRAPTKDLVEWLAAYQKLNGITNARLSERSGIPKGTIDGLKSRTDVRHDTFLPLLKAAIEMTGGVWDGDSCPVTDSVSTEQRQEILRLTEELKRASELHERSVRVAKERTVALVCMFALSVGMLALLLLISL